MATVDMTGSYLAGAGGHVSAMKNTGSYLVEVLVDLADVVTEKGSAIAQGDVIEVIDVPAGTLVKFAGIQVLDVMTGTSTDATIDFGVTGGDVDAFVDGFDLDGAAANAYATVASAAVSPAQFFSSADTLDILVATQTGTITGGKLRVFAELLNCAPKSYTAGIARVGS